MAFPRNTSADLSAKTYYLACEDGVTAGTVKLATAAQGTNALVGIIKDGGFNTGGVTAYYPAVSICDPTDGPQLAILGGSVTLNTGNTLQYLTSDANGKSIVTITHLDQVVAWAMNSGASGDYCAVMPVPVRRLEN